MSTLITKFEQHNARTSEILHGVSQVPTCLHTRAEVATGDLSTLLYKAHSSVFQPAVEPNDSQNIIPGLVEPGHLLL
jgi:hypothetical protein